MDIKTLEYMTELLEGSSTAEVAESHFLTRQAVSQMMQRLEEELGVPVFVRTRKGLVPTAAGQVVYGHVKSILTEHASMLEELQSLGSEKTSVLRVGFTRPAYMSTPLSFFDKVKKLYPKLGLSVCYGKNMEMAEKLKQGSIDLFIGVPPLPAGEIHSQLLCRRPICCVASTETIPDGRNFLSLEDLAGKRLLITRGNQYAVKVLQLLAERRIPFQVEEVEDSDILINLRIVRSRPGTVYMTSGNWIQTVSPPPDVYHGMLEPETPDFPAFCIYAVWLQDKAQLPESAIFANELSKVLQGSPEEKESLE